MTGREIEKDNQATRDRDSRTGQIEEAEADGQNRLQSVRVLVLPNNNRENQRKVTERPGARTRQTSASGCSAFFRK